MEKKLHNSYHYNFAKGDYDQLRNCVSSQVVVDKIKDMNVTQVWKTFKDIVILAKESCIPKVKIRSGKIHPLWMNNNMMATIKKKKQAYKRYLQTRDGTDYLYYTRIRNQAKHCCRTAVRNFEKKIARNAKQDIKAD